MMKTIKTLTAALLASATLSTIAAAEDIYEAFYASAPDIQDLNAAPVLTAASQIGLARIDNGRLIVTPHTEMKRWSQMGSALSETIGGLTPIDVARYVSNTPDIPMHGRDSDNKLDEIRMTAADQGLDYVLLYGLGKDADWGSFGGKSLTDTGLSVPIYHTAHDGAKAKALLVNTFTGEVHGAAFSSETEFGIRDLTFDVQRMINTLAAHESLTAAL